MKYTTLEVRTADGVRTITLHRPDRLNAFTLQMACDLIDAFERASEDDDVRAVIVTGAGRAFCAGMDLSGEGNVFGLDETLRPTWEDVGAASSATDIADGLRDIGGRVNLAILACKKPVIAAINGSAVGIGATLTLAMDFRLASEDARIGFVFAKIGIVPDGCASWLLPRLVGMQQALEWCYSGEIFPAAEGLRAGLLRQICAPDQLLQEAETLARKLTRDRSPVSIALTRQMLWRNGADAHPMQAHRVESLAIFYTSIEDGKEGVQAFLEKRAPRFEAKASRMPPFYPWW